MVTSSLVNVSCQSAATLRTSPVLWSWSRERFSKTTIFGESFGYISGKYISSHSITANRFLGFWAKSAAIPAGILAPDSLVLTPSPAKSRRIVARCFVEVVLPLVPETTTMSLSELSFEIAFGSRARITLPLKVSPRPRPSATERRPARAPALQAVSSLRSPVTDKLALDYFTNWPR